MALAMNGKAAALPGASYAGTGFQEICLHQLGDAPFENKQLTLLPSICPQPTHLVSLKSTLHSLCSNKSNEEIVA
jgi:hypothetical protein